jgi:hypothetical protein
MSFTPTDFHDLVESDIWVLEQMLTLLSDPAPVITKIDTGIEIQAFETIGMSQMQDAVRDYRRRLLPAIFVVTQKVYAELFRVVLGSAGHSAGNRQVDVEQALQPLIAAGSISARHPFTDAPHFLSWWGGQYDFQRLRLARNQVVHKKYPFAGGRLSVADDSGTLLLDWSENTTLEFARAVLELAKQT